MWIYCLNGIDVVKWIVRDIVHGGGFHEFCSRFCQQLLKKAQIKRKSHLSEKNDGETFHASITAFTFIIHIFPYEKKSCNATNECICSL